MIEVKNLTKKYGSHLAVNDLSFQVDKNMIYGFLGPNGAGKSTTMNIMTGYIAATDGTVLIDGYDMLKEPEEAKKHIGYLPEQPPVYPDMTVTEYLRFAAELKWVQKTERTEQIEKIMAQMQLEDVGKRLIRNLSKGYKQRVGLAQAIIGYPETIILDEPMVGLDPKQIIEIRALIKELAKNHTIILSSHILSEISTICDHIMIMSKGKLVACDTPEGLMTLMKGGKQLEIIVLGKLDRFEEVLRNIDGIETFHIEQAKKEEEIKATINTAIDKDIRKELFYRLAAADMPIMQLGAVEKSLEDVFLELTSAEETTGTIDIMVENTSESEQKVESREGSDDDSDI